MEQNITRRTLIIITDEQNLFLNHHAISEEALLRIFYITDHRSVLDYPCLSLPSLYLSVTYKAPSDVFHSDPQLPSTIVSDRFWGTVINPRRDIAEEASLLKLLWGSWNEWTQCWSGAVTTVDLWLLAVKKQTQYQLLPCMGCINKSRYA